MTTKNPVVRNVWRVLPALPVSFKLGDERLKQKMFDSSFFFPVGQLLTTSELLNLQFVDSVFLWCFIPWKRCCDWPMAWNSRGDQKSHLTSKVWRVLLAMSPLAPLMAAAPAGSRFSSGFTQLVNELRQAGPKRLMVITDFDQTLLGQKGEHLLLLGYT